MPKTSFLEGLRPSRLMGQLSVQEMLDQAAAEDELDVALKRLTEATNANVQATTAVRRSQSSGSLKLVATMPPPALVPPTHLTPAE